MLTNGVSLLAHLESTKLNGGGASVVAFMALFKEESLTIEYCDHVCLLVGTRAALELEAQARPYFFSGASIKIGRSIEKNRDD